MCHRVHFAVCTRPAANRTRPAGHKKTQFLGPAPPYRSTIERSCSIVSNGCGLDFVEAARSAVRIVGRTAMFFWRTESCGVVACRLPVSVCRVQREIKASVGSAQLWRRRRLNTHDARWLARSISVSAVRHEVTDCIMILKPRTDSPRLVAVWMHHHYQHQLHCPSVVSTYLTRWPRSQR